MFLEYLLWLREFGVGSVACIIRHLCTGKSRSFGHVEFFIDWFGILYSERMCCQRRDPMFIFFNVIANCNTCILFGVPWSTLCDTHLVFVQFLYWDSSIVKSSNIVKRIFIKGFVLICFKISVWNQILVDVWHRIVSLLVNDSSVGLPIRSYSLTHSIEIPRINI